MICLFVYVTVMLLTIKELDICKTSAVKDMLIVKWVRFEGFLFLSNLLGIPIFMFTKSILSRLGKKI